MSPLSESQIRALTVGAQCKGGWQPEKASEWRDARVLMERGLLMRPKATQRYTTTGRGRIALDAEKREKEEAGG